MAGNRFVIRTIGRSVLLAVAVLSFPLLRSAISDPSSSRSPAIGDDFYLPLLLADLRHHGLLRSGDNAAFLGNPGSWLHFLERSGFELISDDRYPAAADSSLYFVFAATGWKGLDSIDRAVKIGGFAAVVLGSDEPFVPPKNYRIAYIRRLGPSVVAVQKIADAGDQRRLSRRLLAVPEAKKEALNLLEDALLEPPRPRGRKQRRRPRYLPELTGDSLDNYRRRVFVEVAPAGRGGSAAVWFERHYPRGDREFEIIRVDEVGAEEWKEDGGMAEWLERNVREEDYVVVKAEAEVMEEVVRKGDAIRLVDELFLECKNQWEEKGNTGSRRAYWECLALYGRIRDQSVAVHQWWGSS
ncbi:uncharacterized protein [Typha latifolia]|uniref:uncharacterized protein n=1 Tax=Typha latifolia TaxID=4733 RepID=UPI003C2F0B84